MSTKAEVIVPSGDPPLSDEKKAHLLKAYEQLCISYHAIDDFRAKLLAFLPLATSGGIFFLLNQLTDDMKPFFEPIGVFGFLITFGLFSYEIFGIKKCHALLQAGEQIEALLDMDQHGQFATRPQAVARLMNEPFAAGIIYPAVLAAWVYVALAFSRPQAAIVMAGLVFVAGFTCLFGYDLSLRKSTSRASADKPGKQAKKAMR